MFVEGWRLGSLLLWVTSASLPVELAVCLSNGERRPAAPTSLCGQKGWGWLSHSTHADRSPPARANACPFSMRPVPSDVWLCAGAVGKDPMRCLGLYQEPGTVLCRLQGGDTLHILGACMQPAAACLPGTLAALRIGRSWDMRSMCWLQAGAGSRWPSLCPWMESGVEDRQQDCVSMVCLWVAAIQGSCPNELAHAC